MTPIRLEKQPEKNNYVDRFLQHILRRIEAYCIEHALFFFTLFIILSLLLFVVLIYALVGVSATESGTVYNQFNNII